jgi:hypothetical protein
MNENPNEERSSKPSYKEAKRRHDLHFKGCALRTITSIAGATLTRNEEDLWLGEQDKQDQTAKAVTDPDLVLKNKNVQETLHDISFSALDRLVHFYTKLASDTSTSVGKNLSKLEAKWGILSPDMITQFHFLGSKIAILEGGSDLNGHIYHIAPTINGEFISRSDNDQPVKLDNNQYLCIVFSPKSEK